jgi:hypothetical protein
MAELSVLAATGAVIVACEDGHPWTPAERRHPYRIVRVPGVAGRELAYLADSASMQVLDPDALKEETSLAEINAARTLL